MQTVAFAAGRRVALSLVELIFALVVAVIFIMGIFSTLGTSVAGDSFINDHQAASNAAFEQLDLAMALSFGTVSYDFPVELKAGVDGNGDGDFADAGDVPAILLPAAPEAYWPRATDNGGTALDEAALFAGHVTLSTDLDGDGNPDSNLDVYGDGSPSKLAVRVVVAWTGRDGTGNKVSISSIKSRNE